MKQSQNNTYDYLIVGTGFFGAICAYELTVEDGDLVTAKKLIKELHHSENFYKLCSKASQELYQKHYHESNFKLI